VLPVTSFSYVLSAVVGAVYIKERVSGIQWLGIGIITLGILLVVLTYPKTSEGPDTQE
jgi:drug/metabolite transporter (DMT)-like permease